MTKKLSELFNLPPNDDNGEESSEQLLPKEPSPFPPLDSIIDPNDINEITTNAISNLEKIEAALPQIRGLEAADSELDDLASLAVNSYKDLMDLGQQVDSRFSSEIFAVGSTMLGHAITAKTAKINKKLKTIELQLKKAALDQKSTEKSKEVESTPIGNGRLLDRNELLRMMSENRGNNSSSKDK